jgi:GTP-binding protein
MKKPLIAIVGRPNVGKSTFFNKVVGKRISIVKDEPGVTRDRIYADAEWLNHKFTLIDTGGIVLDATSEVQKNILIQAKIAMDLADVILFFVDGKHGITPEDFNIAEYLRKNKKPVFLVVNKLDNNEIEATYDFFALGLGNAYAISAEHLMGVGDLLDDVYKKLDFGTDEEQGTTEVKIAIVGKPNVGKSSIVNKLLGEERMVVSEVAGTTRDAIDTPFTFNDNHYVLIDTAGIRRKSNIEFESIEQYSVLRSLEAIRRADVVILVLDASEPLSEQDIRIAGIIHEEKKPSIIIVNKWDKIEKDTYTVNQFDNQLKEDLKFMDYYIPLFISAKTGQRINKIMETCLLAYENASRRASTSVLNEILQDAVRMSQPPAKNGKRLKLYFISQPATNPPTFVIMTNDPKLMHFSYQRYLENELRRSLKLSGTPIKIIFRDKNESGEK